MGAGRCGDFFWAPTQHPATCDGHVAASPRPPSYYCDAISFFLLTRPPRLISFAGGIHFAPPPTSACTSSPPGAHQPRLNRRGLPPCIYKFDQSTAPHTLDAWHTRKMSPRSVSAYATTLHTFDAWHTRKMSPRSVSPPGPTAPLRSRNNSTLNQLNSAWYSTTTSHGVSTGRNRSDSTLNHGDQLLLTQTT